MIQTLACGAYGWFQQALIRLCVCAAAALFAVLILRTQAVRDAAARIAALWREASYWMRLVAMSLVFGFVIHAGTKTNSPPLGMMMPLRPPLPQSVVQQITEQEIAQGWRLESVVTNDAVSYAMPEGISPTFNWYKRGTFGEWSRLDLGDFAFPIGTNGETVTSFSVFSDGRIRPRPRDVGREICAVGVPMLAMQGASRFWVAEEAAVATGRDPPNPDTGGTRPVVSVELTWREGVNSNAYYFVDVVAERGPAPIYFTGDRASRLGSPVVVARGGETNHVPLLIGINYAVTSIVPISISLPTNSAPPGAGACYAAVMTNGASSYAVQWPLNFVFNESIGESDRVYSVSIEPFDPGGELTWGGAGGGMRSGASSECNCGCLHCGGYSVWFSCSAVCMCSGECQAVGNYTVEDALFAVTGGVCRCGFDDPGPAEAPTTNAPSLSVSFSRRAVIFEDAYEDRRGVIKPRRSSRVRITVDAYGGEYGGVLALLLSCIEPSGIEVREVDLCTYGLPAGKAGGIGLLMAFYVKPFTVSFSEIAVEEVPCDEGFAEGYFRHAMPSNLWSHTTSAGAGKWIDVFPGNRVEEVQLCMPETV